MELAALPSERSGQALVETCRALALPGSSPEPGEGDAVGTSSRNGGAGRAASGKVGPLVPGHGRAGGTAAGKPGGPRSGQAFCAVEVDRAKLGHASETLSQLRVRSRFPPPGGPGTRVGAALSTAPPLNLGTQRL